MGRPKEESRDMVREKVVTVRVKDGEYRRWRAAAARSGMSFSDWLRHNVDRAARL